MVERRFDDEVKVVYKNIGGVLKQFKSNEIVYTKGNFTVKFDKGKRPDLTGEYIWVKINNHSDELYDFCQENKTVFTNT